MNKIHLFASFIIASMMIVISSCDPDSQTSETLVSVTVSVEPEDELELPEGTVFSVTVTNYNTRSEVSAETDENGTVTFTDLVVGTYTITASASISEEGVSYICTGTLSNVNILEDGLVLTVPVSVVVQSQLVIKEMYYTFSKNESGSSYVHDQFIEIYNNSDLTAYVDGLCIAWLIPETATGLADYAFSVVGAEEGEYCFASGILKVPGNVGENNYPVEPGESVLFCKWAKNHQTEDGNPLSPVDLSGGEFEYYAMGQNTQQDESAINLELAYYRSKTTNYTLWVTSISGWAYIIFFPEDGDFDTSNELQSPTYETWYSYPIHVDRVLDAVECVANETQAVNKRVPTILDSGSIWVTDEAGEPVSSGAGRSIARKVSETTEDGRVILQDTNNSAADFESMDAVARRYDVGIPSWNTWATR